MGHAAFRGVLIGVGLIVFVFLAFSVILGGAGLFADSKLDARADQIEAEMLAELPADMPAAKRDALKEKTKLLARKAAELEASGLIGSTPAIAKTTDPAKSASAQSGFNNSQHSGAPADVNAEAGVNSKEWKFGDPSTEVK